MHLQGLSKARFLPTERPSQCGTLLKVAVWGSALLLDLNSRANLLQSDRVVGTREPTGLCGRIALLSGQKSMATDSPV